MLGVDNIAIYHGKGAGLLGIDNIAIYTHTASSGEQEGFEFSFTYE